MLNLQRRPNISEVIYRLTDFPWVASHVFRQLFETYHLISPSEFSRLYRDVRSLTMCSGLRLRGLYHAVRHVVTHNISGDVVECGVARGGSAALMALTLKALNNKRQVWLFDTFEGLPSPTSDDPDYEIARHYERTCKGSLEDVRASFERLGVAAVTVKGLFQDTLPKAKVGAISVLHIDGDWYESTRACLENLYDRVVPGGIIQLDDYGYWKGSAKAVDEFFACRGISPVLKRLDYSGRQFAKPFR